VASLLLAILTVVSLGVVVVFHLCQRRHLATPAPHFDGPFAPVSVLKPLKGVDADLEANLESFFRLDYPCYEVVLGVADPGDPALEVARRVAARHPHVPSAVVADERRVGHNPKVNNLANLLARARHGMILISDSNVAADPALLRDMVAELEQPGVGLVTSQIRGVGGTGLGGVLEAVQLNAFVSGAVAAVTRVGRRVCAVGKSMLLRRSDLERIGGFHRLGRYLAEDQVCGEEVRALGLAVVVSSRPVDNVLGHLGVRGFSARHLRWARIRRRIAAPWYLAEVLANPVPPALALVAVDPRPVTAGLAAATLGTLSVLARGAERRLAVRRSALVYPPLELLRGVLVGLLWPVPFVSSSVEWRGNRFTLGRRTLLEPAGRRVLRLRRWRARASDENDRSAIAA